MAAAGAADRLGACMARLFSGVGVALVTIFDQAGEVDLAATAGLARDLVGRGLESVLVAGTTGEAGTLTDAERVALIEAVRAAVPAQVPVLAGTGAASAQVSVELTAAAVRAGADAVLAFPPPGCGTSPGGDPAADPDRAQVRAFYSAVADAAGGRPVLVYHIPWISAPGVPVDQLADLPVIGQKDSSGSPDRLLDELAHYDGDTYVGSSAVLALAGPMGGAGAILAIANVEPERCVRAFGGDGGAQRELADTHLAVRAGGPAGLKRILASGGEYPAFSRV